MLNGLENPLVWELLPLDDQDRATGREVSKGVRAAVDEAWARRGVVMHACQIGTLQAPRWDNLTRLRIRDAALRIGRFPAWTMDILTRQAPFARLWQLHLRFVKFPAGFAWRRDMLPALRDLYTESFTTSSTHAADVLRFVDMFRAIVPQLHALEIKFEALTSVKFPCPKTVEALAALAELPPAPAPHMLAYANAGHDILKIGVDAPLRKLRLNGSLDKVGAAAHATLQTLSLRGPLATVTRGIDAFRNLENLTLEIRFLATVDSLRAAAESLRVLPAALTRMAVDFDVRQLDEPHTHARAVTWPARALAHLARLEVLDLTVFFPLGMGNLVRGLIMGARPRRATLRARSSLTDPLEDMMHNLMDNDGDSDYDDELAYDLRVLVDELETIPDVTPEDVDTLRGALPGCELTLHGVSIF
jgi:hypothetical protein